MDDSKQYTGQALQRTIFIQKVYLKTGHMGTKNTLYLFIVQLWGGTSGKC